VKGWRRFLLARNFDVNLASGSGKVHYSCCVQLRRCYVIMRKVTRILLSAQLDTDSLADMALYIKI